WSLTTLNSNGIRPDALGNPPLIDGNVMIGYTYARQPGLRITKDLFDKHLWLSFAAESSATTWVLPGSNGNPAGGATVAGLPIIGTTGIIGPAGVTPLLFA